MKVAGIRELMSTDDNLGLLDEQPSTNSFVVCLDALAFLPVAEVPAGTEFLWVFFRSFLHVFNFHVHVIVFLYIFLSLCLFLFFILHCIVRIEINIKALVLLFYVNNYRQRCYRDE